MSLIERAGLAALRRMDPERAHTLAIVALKTGMVPLPPQRVRPRLETRIAELTFRTPIGLAAGFDKNAEGLGTLMSAGFGFVEAGAVTPEPQPGNPKPRLFRLAEDRAIINRFGFNNDGMRAVAARLANRPKRGTLGLNLGANKDSSDRAADFARVLLHCGADIDFATINVSSPNTENLRDLQGPEALRTVLSRTQDANQKLASPVPLFVKIAPDLTEDDLDQIAAEAVNAGLSGIIATNTTVARPDLKSRYSDQTGGLSGEPLFAPSTRILAELSARTSLPLIGVGGISTLEHVLAKFAAGASAVQLYSALIYQGLGLADRLAADLDRHLSATGQTLQDLTPPR
ncbi:MAG: quinone-dependent dihydroorotate dehydrogenase [Pseudomonadota bacterium]